MQTRRYILPFAVVLALVAVVLIFCWTARSAPPSLITLRYVLEYDADGSLSDNPSFWVTNHTGRTLSIYLMAIEVRTGSNWTTLSPIPAPGALFFQTEVGRSALVEPHGAAYGNMLAQRIALPSAGSWRVRASVVENLVGLEKIRAELASYPRRLRLRLAGNRAVSLAPFTRGGHLSRRSEVFSQATGVVTVPLSPAQQR
jgi:hypothetical protein